MNIFGLEILDDHKYKYILSLTVLDKKPIQIYSAERFLPNTNIYGLEIPDKYKYIQVDDFLQMFATSLTFFYFTIAYRPHCPLF